MSTLADEKYLWLLKQNSIRQLHAKTIFVIGGIGDLINGALLAIPTQPQTSEQSEFLRPAWFNNPDFLSGTNSPLIAPRGTQTQSADIANSHVDPSSSLETQT